MDGLDLVHGGGMDSFRHSSIQSGRVAEKRKAERGKRGKRRGAKDAERRRGKNKFYHGMDIRRRQLCGRADQTQIGEWIF